jgi:hypothetical protein
MRDLADVSPQAQRLVDITLVQQLAGFVRDALHLQAADRLHARAGLDEQFKDAPHARSLRLIHHQLAVGDVVAEGHLPTHPHPASLRRRHLVPDPLPDHFALELCKAEQDVQRQPSHTGGRVKRLRDGDEGHPMRLHRLDELGEVHQRSR